MSKLRRPSPPAPTRSDSQSIVDAILGATVELLRRGEPFSNEAIIERAGVGRASLYRYFPDRGALLAEVFRQQHRRFNQALIDGLRPGTSLESGVSLCVELMARMDEGELNLRRHLNLSIPLTWSMEVYQQELEVGISELTEWLSWHLPDVPQPDRMRRVFYAMALVRGAVLLRLFRPDTSPSSDDMVRDLTPLVTAIVRGN